MILKNKLTREKLELTLSEFKTHFAKEIQVAFESYKQTELTKPYFKIKTKDESDFYFDLQWNFNNHACSYWYIESC